MTDHKSCRYLLSSLSEYVDGELGVELCQELERHMEGCENCQIVVDTLQKTVYLYNTSSETPDMPSEVRTRLFKRLALDEFLEKGV